MLSPSSKINLAFSKTMTDDCSSCPLHESTKGLFNKELISKMKDGAWLINTARGAIVVKEDVAEAVNNGKLRGYGGDVWFPQPAPKDHPLRYIQNSWGGGNAMGE